MSSISNIKVGSTTYDIQATNYDNLTIGGRNYLVNTTIPNVKATTATSGYIAYVTYYTANQQELSQFGFKTGDVVTLSFDWDITNSTVYGNFRTEWYGATSSGNNNYIAVIKNPVAIFSTANTSGHEEITCELTDATIKSKSIAIRIDNSSLTFTISNIKLEKGSKATDWTPAPEDKADIVHTHDYLPLTGNAVTATTASQLGIDTVGGETIPIYLDSGIATTCSGRTVPGIKAAATKVSTGWGTNNNYVVDVSLLSYWDGSYDGRSSNLTYCNKGAFGDMATKSSSDYIPISGSSAITGNLEFSQLGNSGTRGIVGSIASNDYWRVVGGATDYNNGYLEIATADDGSEPIYVRQYSLGKFVTLKTTLTLLDENGDTIIPGSLKLSNNITYTGTKASYDMIKFIDNTSDTYGNGIAIGGGGLTIIGGGESSNVIKDQFDTGGYENMVIANDGVIDFYTNCQSGFSSAKHITMNTDGTITAAGYNGLTNSNVITALGYTPTSNDASNFYIRLIGGDGNTAGYRLIGTATISTWSNKRLLISVSSRHSGNGIICFTYGCQANTLSEENCYCKIDYYGSNKGGDLINEYSYQCYISSDFTTMYFFWKFVDFDSVVINILDKWSTGNSEFLPANGTWMTSIDSDTYGTLFAKTNLCNVDEIITIGGKSNVIDGLTSKTYTLSDIAKGSWSNVGTSSVSISNAIDGYLLFSNPALKEGHGIGGIMGANDFWTIRGYATSADEGFLEIATGDGGKEPIYVRQYFNPYYPMFAGNIDDTNYDNYKQITLMDENGDTTLLALTTTIIKATGAFSFVKTADSDPIVLIKASHTTVSTYDNGKDEVTKDYLDIMFDANGGDEQNCYIRINGERFLYRDFYNDDQYTLYDTKLMTTGYGGNVGYFGINQYLALSRETGYNPSVSVSAGVIFAGKFRTNTDNVAFTSMQQTTGNLFVIGCGTSDSARKNGLRVAATGNVYGGTYSSSGADYAKYYEWEDGNPNNEDRVGLFVTLHGKKIVIANAEDEIFGAISAVPGIVDNSASEAWNNMYLKDVFGRHLTEKVLVDEITTEDGEVIPAHEEETFVVNPDYDSNKGYVPREQRPEWDAVGLLGNLIVIDDGTCVVDKYCKVSANGVGTYAETKAEGFRVLERIDDTHIEIFMSSGCLR